MISLAAAAHLFLFVPCMLSLAHSLFPAECSATSHCNSPPLLCWQSASISLCFTPNSATGLSCRPLVFLLPRLATIGSPGGHTIKHTNSHPRTGFTFLIWHPLGGEQDCVLGLFVDERSSSHRLIGWGFYILSHLVFCPLFFLHLISLAVMFRR